MRNSGQHATAEPGSVYYTQSVPPTVIKHFIILPIQQILMRVATVDYWLGYTTFDATFGATSGGTFGATLGVTFGAQCVVGSNPRKISNDEKRASGLGSLASSSQAKSKRADSITPTQKTINWSVVTLNRNNSLYNKSSIGKICRSPNTQAEVLHSTVICSA